jgi:hypothetical protein
MAPGRLAHIAPNRSGFAMRQTTYVRLAHSMRGQLLLSDCARRWHNDRLNTLARLFACHAPSVEAPGHVR